MRRYVFNIGWLFADKVIKLLFSALVGVWIARALGPDGFGYVNYIFAVVGIAAVFGNFGIPALVIQDLSEKTEPIDKIITSAMLVHVIGGVLVISISLVWGFALCLDQEYIVGLAIMSCAYLLKVFDVVKYVCEYKIEAKKIVLVENIAMIISSGLKVFAILLGVENLSQWIIILTAMDALFVSIGFFYVGKKSSLNFLCLPCVNLAIKYIKKGWPIVFTGLSVMIFMRIDQLMIKSIVNNEGLGEYSAALKLSEVWYFIPSVLATTFYPKLVELKKSNEEKMKKLIRLMFEISILISFPVALLFMLFGNKLIYIVYGSEYVDASSVLKIHIWTGLFVFMGVISQQWYIVQARQKMSMHRVMIAGAGNALLNYYMIPKYGIIGAAWATLIAQAFSGLIFNAVSAKSRELFKIQISALKLSECRKLLHHGKSAWI